MADKDTELLAASEAGKLSRVQELIAEGLDVSKTNQEGWSPLIMASKGGHDDVVRALLENKAAPNPACVAHTALRAAAIYGHRETINILLAAHADPNMVSLHGRTPLMGAAMAGHVLCAQLLLEAGAHYDTKNDVGETAADLAKGKGHEDVVDLLHLAAVSHAIEAGRGINVSQMSSRMLRLTLKGNTLLDTAVRVKDVKSAQDIIAAGGARGTPSSSVSTTSIQTSSSCATHNASVHARDHSGVGSVAGRTGSACSDVVGEQLKGWRVLVVGGTQFMGRQTVEALVEEECDVTIVTRGKSKNPHPECVNHLICDRVQERERFSEIVTSAENGPWDAIIDFVAFYKASVMDVVLALNGARTHYIFISTDSVYMACDSDALCVGSDGGVKEEYAKRGAEKACMARDPYQYEYGGRKLEIEECLRRVHETTGLSINYTALRLCDVMGPFDNIGTLLRLKALISTGRPVPAGLHKASLITPPLQSHRVSLVYSRDVARCIVLALRAREAAYGLELNVAGKEQPTVAEFVDVLREELNAKGVVTWDESAMQIFPSVDFGPINSTKAQQILNWAPTPLCEWLKDTLVWYEKPENAAYTMTYALRSGMKS